MKDFLEKRLGIEIMLEDINFEDRLPLLYISLYTFKLVRTYGVEWIIIIPKEQVHLSKLRKQHKQIEKILNLHCAFYLRAGNLYSINTMISEGIPFIIENREIYLPFLGILLQANSEREIKPIQRLSYLCQKLILTAIYENWHEINVSKTAEKLAITKMSASRCFDEIEFLEMPILGLKGRSRVINIPEDKKALWEDLKSFMRTPVISTFYFADDLQLPMKGGMSALAEYSNIEDNTYPSYIVAKKDMNRLGIKNRCMSGKMDMPGSMVQELGYMLFYKAGNIMDPLSLQLSLLEEEKEDYRIGKAVKEMLEEYVW